MSKLFYPRLAIINIKKNSKAYFPFMITCICTIMMYYIMHAMGKNKGLDSMSGSMSLKTILNLGTIVIGIFSVIFLFYTNSFLIKRRKKEIGLYNVLGLEKKHIAKVMFFENLVVSGISLLAGLTAGIILNKLMFLLLLKMLHFKVALGFTFSLPSIVNTLILFIGIFTATLLFNFIQIRILKPIELLKGEQHGEKEPKTKWLMTITGILTLGTGYIMALTVRSPLAALNKFFIAVILVMVGTYALFTSGSITILKLLRKHNKFYYTTEHFISISGMLYRMKQNAVGLANICILSTAVLVMLSTTVALYVGVEDALKARYPRDIVMDVSGITQSEAQKLDEIIRVETKNNGFNLKDKLNYWNNSFAAIKKEDKFVLNNEINPGASNLCMLVAIPVSDYNRLEGKSVTLSEDELIIFSTAKKYGRNSITIGNKTYKVKEELAEPVLGAKDNMDVVDNYILILNDIDAVGSNGKKAYSYGYNTGGTNADIMLLSSKLNEKFKESKIVTRIESAAAIKQEFYMVYGGLFFLGIFLGTLFLIATVLIIYYKQISEGYDDKERFEIMQKVGMSKNEIKKTIRSQVLMIFFLPLVTTVIHIAFAFPMISKLLAVLNLRNIPLFIMSTIGVILVFAVMYAFVFSLTARVYYKIVE